MVRNMYSFFDSDKKIFPGDFPEETKIESIQMSKIFFAFIGAYVLSYVLVLSCAAFLHAFDFSRRIDEIILNIMQLVMMPLVFCFMYKFSLKIPSHSHPVMDKMTPGKFVMFLAVSVFVMTSGNMIGIYVNDFLSTITGYHISNAVEEAIGQMSIFEVFVSAVIFAPVFEELVFRKLFVDKLSKYGTSFCVTVSGLIFGLVHCNFQQFFYAFGVGALFAYIYCIYGKITYPIILHMIINAWGSVVPLLLKITTSGDITYGQMVYIYTHIVAFIAGGIMFVSGCRRANSYLVGGVLMQPYKALFKSKGFYVAVGIIILEFIYSVFA